MSDQPITDNIPVILLTGGRERSRTHRVVLAFIAQQRTNCISHMRVIISNGTIYLVSVIDAFRTDGRRDCRQSASKAL